MMDTDKKAYKITILGEFSSRDLEKEFFNYAMKRSIKYIRPIVLLLGILYMLFIIPDYFNMKDQGTFLSILINRAVFLILVLILFFAIKKFRNYEHLALWITAYEILGTISFLIIFWQYHSPNFLIQAFGVIVVISVIFLAPNKWINTLIASAFISIAFFIFSECYFKKIQFSEFSAGIVYILIVFVLSGIASFRSNYYNRKQYIYSKELLTLSTTDWLTGIYNRAKFDEDLEQWMACSKRHCTPLSIVFFDIDDFKNINDVFGHLAGDKVIVEIVEIVRNTIRKSDVFARWGGDEFMLLLPNTDQQQALDLAERLRESVAGHRFENIEKVTCSFGLATTKKGDSVNSLVSCADQLLYTAKQDGKNRVATEVCPKVIA